MSRDGMIDAAHDVAEGGLAATLAEMALRFDTGARIGLGEVCERDGVDLFTMLFSETQGRAVVAVPRSEEVRFKDMCTMRAYPHTRIGVVAGETRASTGADRARGFLAACAEAGVDIPADAVASCAFDVRSGAHAAARLLDAAHAGELPVASPARSMLDRLATAF